jgi:hypothetical protein
MENIDNLLPDHDGLKWFNKLYLRVTRAIDQQPQINWADAEWLTRLDVIFAGYYFTAIVEFLNDSPTTPSAWDALLESRNKPNVDRIQFALAGMNAHINHDLALALVQTDAEMNLQPALQSPEHVDFCRLSKCEWYVGATLTGCAQRSCDRSTRGAGARHWKNWPTSRNLGCRRSQRWRMDLRQLLKESARRSPPSGTSSSG